MEKRKSKDFEYFTVDVQHILRMLLKRAWVIVLCSILAATAGLCIAQFAITPTYSSTVKLYVNNNSISLGQVSINASQLSAAQQLVKTYGEILKTRDTLKRVAETAGVDYDYETLNNKIKCEPLNETEIMIVTVNDKDPYVACDIANAIAEVLPARVSEIIDGASMQVVDSAIPSANKSAPSLSKYTIKGFLIGALAIILVLIVISVADDTVYDEEYITQNYDYPILGKVPNLTAVSSRNYSYYAKKKNHDNK